MEVALKKKTSRSNSSRSHLIKVYFWCVSYLKVYRWRLIAYILCGIVIALSEMAIPKAIQWSIDYIFPNGLHGHFTALLVIIGLVLGVMFAAKGARNLLQRYITEMAAQDLHYAIFNKLRQLGFSYYEQNSVGNTLALFHTEVAAAQQIFREKFPLMVERLLLTMVAGIFLFTIDYKLSLMVIPVFLLYYTLGPYFTRKAALYRQEHEKHRQGVDKMMYDSVAGQLELRAQGSSEWDLRRFYDKTIKMNKVQVLLFTFFNLSNNFRSVIVHIGVIAIFIYGALMLKTDAFTLGMFVAFILYYFAFMHQLTMFMVTITEQSVMMLQLDKLYRFLHLEPEVKEPEHPLVLSEIKGEIRFQDVCFNYSADQPVLRGLNFYVPAGRKIALVGTSGNGKSTALKLMGRFYDPQEGEITLDDVPLRQLSLGQLREAIGFVFQETYLFGTTIRENIAFGNPQASEEQIKEAAMAAYAHDFIKEFPQGYDTLVGERGVKLSGGQRQRIAIARMFVKNPCVVILDEATSALDQSSEQEVQKALEALLKGRTTIMVAHRLSTVKNCDQIILLDQGVEAEVGTYNELMCKRGQFYELAKGKHEMGGGVS